MQSTESDEADSRAVREFLALLLRDIVAHPERLRTMPVPLYRRLLAVTEGVRVSPDDPIEGPVAL